VTRLGRSTRRARAILVLAVALGAVYFAATVVAPGYFRPVTAPGRNATKGELARIKNAVDMYRITFGRMPESLEDLRNPPDGSEPLLEKDPIDPRGHPYVFIRLDGSDYEIRSLGPDGIPGGEGENADPSFRETVPRPALRPK
jgi:general secretion pathway protein G